MIVRQFLQWVRTAPAGQRAEATAALARAFLYSDLSPEDRVAAEGAMTMLLDDASPLVRQALADTLATSEFAPPAVIHALAHDQPQVAAAVLEHSALLIDADLVEIVATSAPEAQAAIARRHGLPRSVAAAIAEVGAAEACLTLLENAEADLPRFSLDRIVARFGTLAAIREAVLVRDDVPAATRHALVTKLSEALADFVSAREWLDEDRAQRIGREACDKAAVTIAAVSPGEARLLVRHLSESGQLTLGLLLRALLSGNTTLCSEALSQLSGVPMPRVAAIVDDAGAGFRALYDKAGLPLSTFLAFREALEAMREDGFVIEPGGASRLKRRIIERALTRCESDSAEEIEPLLTLLRRFAAEAARDEARLFCDELVATGRITVDPEWHAEAA